MKKWKGVVLTAGVIFVCILIMTMSRMNSLKSSGYQLSGFDGFFYISGMSVLRNLIFPLVLLYSNLYNIRYTFKSYNIVRRNNRLQMWNGLLLSIYVQCVGTIVFSMAVSGGISLAITGTLENFGQANSLFYSESAQLFSQGLLAGNLPVMALAALVLNSGELFLHVMLGVFIYWLTDSQLPAILAIFVANLILPDRVDFFNKGQQNIFCYRELCIPGNVIQSLMFIVIGVVLIEILACMYVPRKNFLK